jgi:hypothetical protein
MAAGEVTIPQSFVILAKAGIHLVRSRWLHAFARMTEGKRGQIGVAVANR